MSLSRDILSNLSSLLKDKNQDSPVQPKEFFWDQFLKYISSSILALTLVNITIAFFQDTSLACFHPPDTASLLPEVRTLDVYEIAPGQSNFINKYCIGSIPVTEYFPVYIVVHGFLLVVPHYIWHAVFKGSFDSFFSIVVKIDRLRNSNTGQYNKECFDRVAKLTREFGGKRKIFLSYIAKLLVQFMACVGAIAVSTVWMRDFAYAFDCPRLLAEEGIIPRDWPLNMTVPCVYTMLRTLRIIRIVDFILTGFAIALTLYGIVWCFIRHPTELGHHQVVKFAFQSGLKPSQYSAPPIINIRGMKYLRILNCCLWLFTRRPFILNLRNLFFSSISSDLDFLLLFLFRADASHGRVFKNIQV